MENYRKDKVRFQPNNLGSLYVTKEGLGKDDPTIYIGGQMEHRFHVIEQTGYTGDPGHNMFDGSWFYDYPLWGKKSEYNIENFAKNLQDALEEAKLENVTLVTESAGGLIGAYATSNPRIKKVVAIHPPIIGTPLADASKMASMIEEKTREDKMLLGLLNIIVNTNYGFEHDNYNGVNLDKIDLDKLLVVSSKLNKLTEKNKVAIKTHDLIYKATGLESDGVVVYDQDTLSRLGIKYLENEVELNHFDAGSKKYINDVYTRTRRLGK